MLLVTVRPYTFGCAEEVHIGWKKAAELLPAILLCDLRLNVSNIYFPATALFDEDRIVGLTSNLWLVVHLRYGRSRNIAREQRSSESLSSSSRPMGTKTSPWR